MSNNQCIIRAEHYWLRPLFLPEGSVATFPEELKLFLPWILKPSLFDFNLSKSPGYLPEQIFAVIKYAIYFLPADYNWFVMSLSEDIKMFSASSEDAS